MKYFFNTAIDCKACLDNTLFALLQHNGNKSIAFLAYKKTNNGYQLLIDSKLDLKILKQIIKSTFNVTFAISDEKIITDNEFNKLNTGFTQYEKSFF